MRISSKDDTKMTPEQCESWLVNNRLFPHLYNPYFEQKDVKRNLVSILTMA